MELLKKITSDSKIVNPQKKLLFWFTSIFMIIGITVFSTERKLKITHHYLNIPIGYQARMKLVEIKLNGKMEREFPVQLAEDSINYWIYIDVSEFKGKSVTLNSPASSKSLNRIYQADQINGSDSMYHESNRPQFHFTVKRGWSNDVNGPIYYKDQYHLFWQAFPFGLSWNTGFMYWGHAVSTDLLHWQELPSALMLDSLGSPWSGSSVIDKNNDGGFGKDALVLIYTAYDRVSNKQVQCIAYSTDNAKTFKRYSGNPVIDSNWEMESNDTRDPHVFWHEPSKHWIMVLLEKDGMSFYNSIDLKNWVKQSHFKGLWECPDFFELAVDGDAQNKKWVLHGGSPEYMIGTFDGLKFTPESAKLRYCEEVNEDQGDLLYASQSFANMPDNRRVQMAWGRIEHPGMPFTQMILFPTEFTLKSTPNGIRLVANPVKEIEKLHQISHEWKSVTIASANEELARIKPGPLHLKLHFTLNNGNAIRLIYRGNELINLASHALLDGENTLEILLDKTVAEIFVNNGTRYLVKNLPIKKNNEGLRFESLKDGQTINQLEIYEMKSIWDDTE
jgi:fructan beta-fructosidase